MFFLLCRPPVTCDRVEDITSTGWFHLGEAGLNGGKEDRAALTQRLAS